MPNEDIKTQVEETLRDNLLPDSELFDLSEATTQILSLINEAREKAYNAGKRQAYHELGFDFKREGGLK